MILSSNHSSVTGVSAINQLIIIFDNKVFNYTTTFM